MVYAGVTVTVAVRPVGISRGPRYAGQVGSGQVGSGLIRVTEIGVGSSTKRSASLPKFAIESVGAGQISFVKVCTLQLGSAQIHAD